MKIKNVLASAAAAALVISLPVQAAAETSLPVRTSTDVEGEGQLFGGSFIIPVIIVVAIGLGLYFALDDSDEEPASP